MSRSWIPILLGLKAFACIFRPINHMHALIVQRLHCLLDIVAAWPILLLDDRAVYIDGLVYLCVARIGENNTYELLVAPDGVDLAIIVGILDGVHLRLRPPHRLLVGLALSRGTYLLGLIMHGDFHADGPLLSRGMLLRLEPLHFGAEAAGHAETLIIAEFFGVFGVVCSGASGSRDDVELGLFEGGAIEGGRVLVDLSLRRSVFPWSRNVLLTLENTLLLRLSEDKRHGLVRD